MQGIKQWARDHPDQLAALLNSNPRYVFFREMPANGSGPPGSLGVPLTPRRSVAVVRGSGRAAHPLSRDNVAEHDRPLNRLMLAQDTAARYAAQCAQTSSGLRGPAARERAVKQRLRSGCCFRTATDPKRGTRRLASRRGNQLGDGRFGGNVEGFSLFVAAKPSRGEPHYSPWFNRSRPAPSARPCDTPA